jgi:3-hydroxy-9,10-secoandrosta-1,3,5(10)-triene-9,17-dione monooxygenase reductase component
MNEMSRGAMTIEAPKYRAVLGHFASGVAIVAAMSPTGPVGLTCQSFFALSLDPPLVAIAAGRSSTSWPRVAEVGAFCVNVLANDQELVCRGFAVPGADKFSGVRWTPTASGSPRIEGVLAWLDCTVERIDPAGDHYLVIGRVHDLGSSTGDPLLFYRSGFGTFSE